MGAAILTRQYLPLALLGSACYFVGIKARQHCLVFSKFMSSREVLDWKTLGTKDGKRDDLGQHIDLFCFAFPSFWFLSLFIFPFPLLPCPASRRVGMQATCDNIVYREQLGPFICIPCFNIVPPIQRAARGRSCPELLQLGLWAGSRLIEDTPWF
jgi:hypothetical protein